MIRLPQGFKEFLRLLSLHEVEYLLIGGYAVGYHGYPRATGDMEVWVAIRQDNAEKLVTVLSNFGFNDAQLSTDLFLTEDQIVRIGVPPLRIELLTTISGVNFDQCYSARITDVIDDVEVHIINREHLKQNKQVEGIKIWMIYSISEMVACNA